MERLVKEYIDMLNGTGNASDRFRFPVFFNDQELYETDWDNESTVEQVAGWSRT